MIKNKRGISLIVLVITIIVMIILAGSIVISLSNSGIIGKAQEAVDETNLKQVEQIAALGWAEAYADGARTQAELQAGVTTALANNNIDTSKYKVNVTTSGVTVTKKGDEVWTQAGTTVTDGRITLNVGDYIDYEATGSDYDGTWQVLGAENGELLVVSSTYVIDEFELGSTSNDLEEAKDDYVTGVTQLDAACEPYGNGSKASSVRSITGEDVDRVAGYDPTTFKGEDAGWSAVMDYGNEVTFYWDGTDYPVYKSIKENGKLNADENIIHSTFTWYDEEEKTWRTATNPGNTVTEETQIVDDNDSTKVAKITNNYCYYEGTKFTDAAYKLLIENDEDYFYYWLASPCAYVYPGYGVFGLRAVYDGDVGDWNLVCSGGLADGGTLGVRAVVSLESDIQLKEGTAANSWTITNK